MTVERPPALNGDALRAELRDPYVGNRIIVLEEVTSTNDYVWQLAREGIAEGLVVFAERQTAGRGQRGNRWESAAHQGLWFSFLLRPGVEPVDSARITTWAAQAVVTTIDKELGIVATIRMPNDVFVGTQKIAGVLVEMRVETGGVYAAIVGIGVNVNQAAEDFPEVLRERAGSLAIAAGRPVDRHQFAVALLRDLDRTYRALFVL